MLADIVLTFRSQLQRIGKLIPIWSLLIPAVLQAQSPDLKEQYLHHRLTNGMDMVFRADTTLPISGIEMSVRNGAFWESDSLDGLSHIFSNLMWDHDFRQHGVGSGFGKARVSGTADNTSLQVAFHPDSLIPVLTACRNRLMRPVPDRTELDRGLALMAREIELAERNPEYFLRQSMLKRLWGVDYSRKNQLGDYLSLRNVKTSTVSSVWPSVFHPQNALLQIRGNYPAEQVEQLVDSIFAAWTGTTVSVGQTLTPLQSGKLPQSQYFTLSNEFVKQPVLLIGWRCPSSFANPEKIFIADVFHTLLQVSGTRFYQAIWGSGLVREMTWEYEPALLSSGSVLRIVPARGKDWNALLEILLQEMKQFCQEGYFSDEELKAAQELIATREFLKVEGGMGSMSQISDYWGRGGMNLAFSYLNRIEEVNLSSLSQFADAVFCNQSYVAGLLASSNFVASLDPGSGFREPVNSGNPGREDSIVAVPTPVDSSLLRLKGLRVYFLAGSDSPDAPSLKVLESVSTHLKTYPERRLFLNGYTDSSGDGVANYLLSKRRAERVKTILSDELGVEPERLVVRGYGEAFPEFEEINDQTRSLNRRVTFDEIPENSNPDAF